MSTGQSPLWIAKYPKMVIFNQEIHSDISKKWNFKHTHAIVQDCTWLEHKLDITVIKHVSYCIQPTALQPTAEPWPPTHYCTRDIYRNEENIHSKFNGATVEDKTLYKVFQLHTSHLYVLYIPTSLPHYYDIMYLISTSISYLVTLHNPRSNLSLTPPRVAVVVVSVSTSTMRHTLCSACVLYVSHVMFIEVLISQK
jgi:hypothetical protein